MRNNSLRICFVLTAFLFIQITGCNSDDSIYKGDGTVVDMDNEGWVNDRDPQERPEDYVGPGGGGITYDEYYETNDENVSEDDDIITDDNDSGEEDKELYKTAPDVAKCQAGEISDYEKNKVLVRVNYIRGLHKLPPVSYSNNDDIYTSECSLMIAANKKLDHYPETNWKCYTDEGSEGCGKSNIYIRFGMISDLKSESIVDAFMTDEGVPSLGHRRWLIDPWLDHISFGRVDDENGQIVGAAIKVNNETEQSIANKDIYLVAYPYEIYPAELYNDEVMMSFTLISDRNNKWNNNKVLFSGAAVAVKDPSNNVLKIKGLSHDNQGYGVPNNIRWFVEGIEKNVRYDVVVTNVIVNSVPKDYTYWFELK
jgi:hypothetical protein